MCGIFGYIKKNEDESLLHRANQIQKHRGPDGNGFANIKVGEWNVGFAHQRLSIIDLSNAAHQPMLSENKTSMLSYNGEIYNYRELLWNENFDTKFGDTRVLFEMLQKYGPSCTEDLNGMWAFSFLESNSKKLVLSRDRFGEKPLYFFTNSESLYFASELKTLLELLPQKLELNFNVMGQFLQQGLTNFSQESIIQNISQVEPGSNLTFDLSGSKLVAQKTKYWEADLSKEYEGTFENACDEIYDTFSDSIRLRLRSDVPLGALLSGGIDSSAITSLMKEQNIESIHTLSAISDNPKLDERAHIKVMSDFLKVKENTIEISPDADESFDLIKKAIYHNDFPISDFSNVMHYKLMQHAKNKGLKVVLSGQGADEIFCGYKKYLGFYGQNLLRRNKYMEFCQLIYGFLANNSILNQFNIAEARRYIKSSANDSVLGEAMHSYQPVFIGLSKGMSLAERQVFDLQKTSVPALTHYEDRMSMAHGIEIRLPYLDHRLVELALTLPDSFKLNKGWTKYIFRHSVAKYLPSSIAWRKDKQGFLNPQSEWLKYEWKSKILDLISSDSLIIKSGIVDHKKMQMKYKEFCKGKNIWHREIITVISLELWLRKNFNYIKV